MFPALCSSLCNGHLLAWRPLVSPLEMLPWSMRGQNHSRSGGFVPVCTAGPLVVVVVVLVRWKQNATPQPHFHWGPALGMEDELMGVRRRLRCAWNRCFMQQSNPSYLLIREVMSVSISNGNACFDRGKKRKQTNTLALRKPL